MNVKKSNNRVRCLKPRLTVVETRRTQTEMPRVRGRAWMEIRERVLRLHPLCVICEEAGRVEAATEVDHKLPLHLGGTNAPHNLQPLCHACHAAKTADEARDRAKSERS